MPCLASLLLAAALAAAPGARQPGRGGARAPRSSSAQEQRAPGANPFKLKRGAGGEMCLDCHADFEARLRKASVHTPVKARNCVGCHDPHAADHAKLLDAAPGALCTRCHPSIVPPRAASAHPPVAKGRCGDCHDAHAAPFAFNLAKGGNDLCAGCHEGVVKAAGEAKYKHRPVQQGCVSCHSPHASARAKALLSSDVPALCLGCHGGEGAELAKRHLGYPVAKARCTSCHDPHGSGGRSLLFDHVHPPVAKAQCTMCHEAASSKQPFRTRQKGLALCRGCHSDDLARLLDRNRVHSPVLEGACLTCHAPHASRGRGLVRAGMVGVCGTCHADTIRRQERSPTKHDPVRDGECSQCHDPHSSDVPLMLVNADGIELCARCHDWQKHASHPIGEDRRDPRNRNLAMGCLSCHRAHGTEYQHLMPYAQTSDLCTKCHDRLKR